jgi:hypothetical protein
MRYVRRNTVMSLQPYYVILLVNENILRCILFLPDSGQQQAETYCTVAI